MTLSEAIQATLVYHDLFDYPLTTGETHQYLIEKKAALNSVEKELKKLKALKKISESRGYWFIKGKSKTVSLRLLRKKYSKAKTRKASFFANILRLIPFLELVAVSGALAMENSHKADDIDFALISSNGKLWTTRFLANVLLWPFKRKPNEQFSKNKVCLNVFIDKSNLRIAKTSLYLAHEISQVKPLWDRNNTYQKFIKANNWIKKYLPNWTPSLRFTVHGSRKAKLSTVNCQLSTVENFLRNFQLWYMHSKITKEKIGDSQLFFHPKDLENWVMSKYRKRLGRLKINLGQKEKYS